MLMLYVSRRQLCHFIVSKNHMNKSIIILQRCKAYLQNTRKKTSKIVITFVELCPKFFFLIMFDHVFGIYIYFFSKLYETNIVTGFVGI